MDSRVGKMTPPGQPGVGLLDLLGLADRSADARLLAR